MFVMFYINVLMHVCMATLYIYKFQQTNGKGLRPSLAHDK